MTQPSVVVAVPTFRRPDALHRLLMALADQHDPGCDWSVLVVVNDGSSPEIPSALADRTSVRVVTEDMTGAAHARNRALQECEAPLIAFIDDDVLPRQAWLKELVAPILCGSADGASGRVELDATRGRPWWWVRAWMDAYLAALDRGSEPYPLRQGEYFLTANVCLLAELVRSVGGFDPLLGPRDGRPMVNDDLQVSFDLYAAGAVVQWAPTAVVVHDVPPSRLTIRWLASRLYCQGRSDLLLARHGAPLSTEAALVMAWNRGWSYLRTLRFRAGWRPGHLLFVAGGLIRAAGILRETVAPAFQ